MRAIGKAETVAILLLASAVSAARAPQPRGAIQVQSGTYLEVPEATFFAFDRRSVPFVRNLHLTMVPAEKHPTLVLPRGKLDSFDELRAEYYGTVAKIGGKSAASTRCGRHHN